MRDFSVGNSQFVPNRFVDFRQMIRRNRNDSVNVGESSQLEKHGFGSLYLTCCHNEDILHRHWLCYNETFTLLPFCWLVGWVGTSCSGPAHRKGTLTRSGLEEVTWAGDPSPKIEEVDTLTRWPYPEPLARLYLFSFLDRKGASCSVGPWYVSFYLRSEVPRHDQDGKHPPPTSPPPWNRRTDKSESITFPRTTYLVCKDTEIIETETRVYVPIPVVLLR